MPNGTAGEKEDGEGRRNNKEGKFELEQSPFDGTPTTKYVLFSALCVHWILQDNVLFAI